MVEMYDFIPCLKVSRKMASCPEGLTVHVVGPVHI